MEKIPSGIYMILNLLNGKRYVGSAVNPKRRRRDHFRKLRKGIHKNAHLQNAFKKYGENAFGWEALEYIENLATLISRENLYLKVFPSWLLYNQYPAAGSPLGHKYSEKECHKRSERMLELWKNEEWCQQMKKIAQKYWENEERRNEQSEILLKRWLDEEYIQKQRDANPMLWKSGEQSLRYGKRNSPETKQKLSKALLEYWADEKRSWRAREALKGNQNRKGKKHDAETKHKISESLRGKRHTAEAKRKMSDARKRWWARRKRAEHLSMLARLVGVLQKRMGGLIVTA